MNSVQYKAAILFVITGLLLSACGTDLWGIEEADLTSSPTFLETGPAIPEQTPTNLLLPLATIPTITLQPSRMTTPTAVVTAGTPRPSFVYFSQSGDTLDAIGKHFNVQTSEISSTNELPSTGLINPNTALVIPNHLSQINTTPSQKTIPDSELVYSPSAQSFNTLDYVRSAGGRLSTFRESMANVKTSGADGIQQIATRSSISPRMLLALIQYYTGWVEGQPNIGVNEIYPLGYYDLQYSGLFLQLHLMVRELLAGYFGWRDGKLTTLTFPNGTILRLNPELNAGTVAVQYMFSRHLNQEDWMQAIDVNSGFPALFTSMYGDPWARSQETGPLFPRDLTQPTFTLPFDVGVLWNLTSGPHAAWEQESALGALDFAPAGVEGCSETNSWVVAIASGKIVRSETGYVVLDLDGDGFEQTGWVVLYQHIATKDRIPVGTGVIAGDHIGHPSCEGGTATGTHVHIARKYNGEWVAAGDPLPFILSGWTAHAGDQLRQGSLTKGDKTITASPVGSNESQIIRLPGE
jgi:LasA protease